MGIIPKGGCHHLFGSRVILPTEVQLFYFDVLGSLGVTWNCNPKKLKLGTSAPELAHMTMKDISRSLQLFSTKTSSTCRNFQCVLGGYFSPRMSLNMFSFFSASYDKPYSLEHWPNHILVNSPSNIPILALHIINPSLPLLPRLGRTHLNTDFPSGPRLHCLKPLISI